MQGRTKGIYEDVFVLLVIVLLGWGGYTFFFSEDEVNSSNTTLTQTQSDKQQQTITIQVEQSTTNHIVNETVTTTERSENLDSQEITLIQNNLETEEKDTENLTQIVEENKNIDYQDVTKSEIIEKIIEKKEEPVIQKVDLELLQKFLIGTKKKIKNSISINSENNEERVNLSIRITVLKDGSFEQLIHTGGSGDLFKNNYENIVNLFPLTIDEKIEGDFPRYLRYSFEFSVKDE